MTTRRLIQIMAILVFFGIAAVGPALASTQSSFAKNSSSYSSIDKSAAFSQWIDAFGSDTLPSDENAASFPISDIGKYIHDQKTKPIEWDPSFMSTTSRYAHYIPGCIF